MKQRLMAALIAALALAMVPRAAAAFHGVELSGAELLAICATDGDAPTDAGNRLFCGGYLEGIYSGYSLASRVMCIPKEVTSDQVRRITVDFLREYPGLLRTYANLLVVTALVREFPCD